MNRTLVVGDIHGTSPSSCRLRKETWLVSLGSRWGPPAATPDRSHARLAAEMAPPARPQRTCQITMASRPKLLEDPRPVRRFVLLKDAGVPPPRSCQLSELLVHPPSPLITNGLYTSEPGSAFGTGSSTRDVGAGLSAG